MSVQQQASPGIGPEVVLALTYADAYRRAAGEQRIHMEHLLMGLFEANAPGTRDALGPYANDRQQFIEQLTAAEPEFKWVPFEATHASAADLVAPLSKHAGAALDPVTARGPDATALDLIHAARAVTDCHVIAAMFPADRRTNLTMVNDTSVVRDEDDRLELRTFADAIAAIIDAPSTKTPVTIAISAPWGAGKTSLARMVQSRLEQKPAGGGYAPHVACWFNAWLHDGATDLASAFAASVAQAADRCRPRWRRWISPLPSSLLDSAGRRRRTVFHAAMLTLFLASLAVALWPILQGVGNEALKGAMTAQTGIGSIVTALVGLVTLLQKLNATRGLALFATDPRTAASSGSMNEVREQITGLIRSATPPGSRFVIFVDDLERCRPPRPIEVLEVINQLLSDAPVVTVLLADLSAVAACADLKYADLAKQNYSPDADQQARIGSRAALPYGWMYLQKIVQLRFDVPVYTADQMQELMTTFVPKHPGAKAPVAATAPAPAAIDARSLRQARLFLQRCAAPGTGLARFAEHTVYPLHQRSPAAVCTFERLRTMAPLASGLAFTGSGAYTVGSMIGARTIRLPLPQFAGLGVASLAVVLTTLVGAWIAWSRRREDRLRLAAARQGHTTASDPAVARIVEAESRYHEFTDESETLNAAMKTALTHLAPLPRTSKRMLNELRLMLYIGSTRGVFSDGAVQPQHFGKWAALRERWPELARLIVSRPQILEFLESRDTEEQLRTDLETLVTPLKNDPELLNFFAAEPPLAGVIDRVVRFTPGRRKATAAP